MKKIFSRQDHAHKRYTRNNKCWAHSLDLTAISPWNSQNKNKNARVLISPRHAIWARHYNIPINSTIRFVDKHNHVVDRRIVRSKSVPASGNQFLRGYDIVVGELDSDVPNTISFSKILPRNISTIKPPAGMRIPVFDTDAEEKALVADLGIESGTMVVLVDKTSGLKYHHRTKPSQNHHRNTHHRDKTKQTTEDSYEVVFPQIIERTGNIIVNDVRNYARRRKRTSEYRNKPIEISISGSGELFDLELWENNALVAPGFKIYRRTSLQHSETEKEIEPSEDIYGCHFAGRVRSHADTPVSLSICNGLNGLIRTKKNDYIIEPLKDVTMHGSSGFIGQPHKLYKRSVLGTGDQHQYEARRPGKRDVTVQRDQNGTDILEIKENSRVLMKDESYGRIHKNYHAVEKRAAYRYKFLKETNQPKTLEMLVVVDKHMYHKHGDANITTYTLTLFNMLSQLFKDGSLGNKINVVLVGLILLEGDERGLNIDYNADDTLNSFCSWQSVLIGANGRQHDHAILLTGLDLCSYKNSPCDTLGFAPMEGMCNRIRSCTVNEDTGLSTAFTIAHEVGHNFGMFHDGEGNYCTESAGKIMSPTLMGKDGQFHWSVCSKAYLMRFLNTPQSVCLDDRPKQVAELKFPDKLPGELYNADIQCKWQFGSKARLCTYDFGKDICKALWCYRGNKRCETKFLPAAEGTSCGSGKWCRQGKCVDYGHDGPKPINGGWSSWTEWSECTRTCGGGVITRERECSRPLPQYGGKTCKGEDKVFKMCNVQECPKDSDDFHTTQCATYNKQPFQGWYLQWKPQKRLNDATDPCKLHCVADTPSYVFTIKHTATDGMKCGVEDSHICVQGECKNVGCDWVVGSDLKNDICGVCDGDNSTCRRVYGQYLEQPKLNTYFPITILPKSARSIRIMEKSLSSNYLAVRNIFGTYFLNGHQRVAWPGTYTLGGAKFRYSRPYNEPETLEADGPLEEELVLEILVQDRNPGIQYEYTLPRTDFTDVSTAKPDNYSWSLSVSSCSERCAGGVKSISAICHKNFEEEVDPKYCADLEKPETGEFPCNRQACPPRWVSENWTSCSRSCGGGRQKRRVRCLQKVSRTKDKKLKRKMCKHLPQPLKKQACNEQECPPEWRVKKWSKCSVSCGVGEQTRKVMCRSRRKVLPDSMCPEPKPEVVKSCRRAVCPAITNLAAKSAACPNGKCGQRWVSGDFGECTKECGGGMQKRKVQCENSTGVKLKNKMCRGLTKPAKRRQCNTQDCPVAWHTGKWSKCSVSCGEGKQRREVDCRIRSVSGDKTVVASRCGSSKPTDVRSCDLGSCDVTGQFDWLLSPWGPCSKTCGHGQSSRYLRCARIDNPQQPQIRPDTDCNNIPKPRIRMTESCFIMDCIQTTLVPPQWEVTGWSECSKSCGEGIQSRIVSCVNTRGQPSSYCDKSTEPEFTRPCNNGQCMPMPLGQVFCDDKFAWCHLVPDHGVCHKKMYARNCCKSCSGKR